MMDDYLRLYDYVLPLYMLCALWFLRDTAVVRMTRRETVVVSTRSPRLLLLHRRLYPFSSPIANAARFQSLLLRG